MDAGKIKVCILPWGESVRGDSVGRVASKLPWPTAQSAAVRAGSRAGRREGRSLLPLWSPGDVTAPCPSATVRWQQSGPDSSRCCRPVPPARGLRAERPRPLPVVASLHILLFSMPARASEWKRVQQTAEWQLPVMLAAGSSEGRKPSPLHPCMSFSRIPS